MIYRFVKSFFSLYRITVSVSLYFLFTTVCPAEEMTLGQKLEGLGAKPRIAYLKYLVEKKEGSPDIYFYLGLAYQQEAKTDSALHYYEMAVTEDTTLFKAFTNMGIIYDGMGNFAKSGENYRKAIKLKPDAVLPNSYIAHLYYRMGKYTGAIKHLMTALRNHPEDAQPHFYLAIFFWDSMMYREAINEWEEVIKLDPKDYLAQRAKENIAMVKRVINDSSSSITGEPR